MDLQMETIYTYTCPLTINEIKVIFKINDVAQRTANIMLMKWRRDVEKSIQWLLDNSVYPPQL